MGDEERNRAVLSEGFNYDWATYDLFPLFKGDFRPVADTLERLAIGVDPHDACDKTPVPLIRTIVTSPIVAFSWFLRVLPFMQTDPEQTRTIGHLDPPSVPRGALGQYFATGHPFGTTHELRGIDPALDRTARKRLISGSVAREVPVAYDEVVSPQAECPVAKAWLLRARHEVHQRYSTWGAFWDSACAGADAPALRFLHGFERASIAPITRPNDPFWNVRAFDTALARHDGYMLSSFICAMNQLVLDDPGGTSRGLRQRKSAINPETSSDCHERL
jgi:hypothetical protein